MKTYTVAEIAQLLPYPALAEALAEMLTKGSAHAPERIMVPLSQNGRLLVMPAADSDLAITKIVTVHPDNALLATVQSEVLVMSAATGERLALLDGASLTGRRTAALSLLAATRLGADPQGPLLIVGAGVQARAHLEAFRAGLGTREVILSSRTPTKTQMLASYAQSLGMSVRIENDPDEAVQRASLIVTATTSLEPVLKRPLGPHQLVCAVGAFTPEMAELAPELVASSRVVVDTLEGARAEAGELIQAVSQGVWHWDQAIELGAQLEVLPERPTRATIFKSVGHAMFDLAACKLLLKRVLARVEN